MKADIQFKLLPGTPEDCDPKYADDADSGFELYVLEDLVLYPFVPTLVGHGVALALEPGFDLELRPRSSSLPKDCVHIQLGTIDNGYRGELKSVVVYTPPIAKLLETKPVLVVGDGGITETQELANRLHALTSVLTEPLHIPAQRVNAKTGKLERTRLCQAVVTQLIRGKFERVDELGETSRGAGGFGSSGG